MAGETPRADPLGPPQGEIRHVQRIQRAAGNVDLYFRKAGDRRPLYSPDNTEALRLEVAAILAELGQVARAKTPKPGAVGGLLKVYNRSEEFLALSRATQTGYQYLIDELTADIGEVTFEEVTGKWVRELKNLWALRGYRAANTRLQVLKNALLPAIADGDLADPFIHLVKARRPHDLPDAHPAWDDAEVAVAIEDALARKRPGLARAIGIGRWGGFRKQTIIALPRHARIRALDVDGLEHRRIEWMTAKRKVLVNAPEDPRLTDLLARTPDLALTIAYNADGEPWKLRALSHAVDRHMARLAKAGRVRAAADDKGEIYCPLDIHGLRHARGVELAESGASDAEIMSQLGHTSTAAAKIYRAQASRKKLADQAQQRVNNAVSLAEARRKKAAAQNDG